MWDQPVSERAYSEVLRQAAKIIGDIRANRRTTKHSCIKADVFIDFDLGRIGSHSLIVSLLVESGVSMKIISAITATSVSTLSRHYDSATELRRRKALKALSPVLEGLCADKKPDDDDKGAGIHGAADVQTASSPDDYRKWCPRCGRKVSELWRFCYHCGMQLPVPGPAFRCIPTRVDDSMDVHVQCDNAVTSCHERRCESKLVNVQESPWFLGCLQRV